MGFSENKLDPQQILISDDIALYEFVDSFLASNGKLIQFSNIFVSAFGEIYDL